MTSCSFGIRNVQLTLLSLALCSSSFCFNIAAEPADERVYENTLKSGGTDLDQSYQFSARAETKAREAKKIAAAACPLKNDALHSGAKEAYQQATKLEEEAKAAAETALKKFRYAETLKPGDGRAVFGEGLALLQLKEYCLAIEKIEFARGAMGPTLETTFALGAARVASSNVGSREFREGIELLTKYIKQAEASTNPKEEFPNLEIAIELKKDALKKPEDLADENKQKNEEPNAAECPMPPPGKTELPFAVSFSSAIGYNDNVITLGRDQALPLGAAGKGSVYNESSLTLGRDFSLSHPWQPSKTGWLADQLSLSYVFIADTFAEFPERDTLLNTVLGSYQRSFTPHLGGLLKITDQWLYIDQSLASNLFTAQEALVVNLNARLKTLLSYYLIRTDGFTDSTPLNDPDGFTHRVEVAQSWVIVQDAIDFSPKFTLSVQYGHEWDEPNGITGQFQRNDLQGKIDYKVFRAQDQCSFLRAVTASLSETWRSDGYVRTTLSSSACPGCARSDDANQLLFALSISMWSTMSILRMPVCRRQVEWRHIFSIATRRAIPMSNLRGTSKTSFWLH